MKNYVCTTHILVPRQITVKAADRQQAIEKASALANRRYGDSCTGTLSVPFLEGDF